MAIMGIGIDIIEISRVESIIARFGHQLAHRVLRKNEYVLYKKHRSPARFLAKRFAAKEAVAKSFSVGIRNGLAFNQFEIFNDTLGKPRIRLHKAAKILARKMGVKSVHVSLSDEISYACATVIIES